MKNKIIITAGGTSERIDNVRKITNSSTGKLGKIIAEELIKQKNKKIEKIYYICAKNSLKPKKNKKIQIIEILDTNSLKNQIEILLKNENINYFIHSMAVSDYCVEFVTSAENIAQNIIDNKPQNSEQLYNCITHLKNVFLDSKISSDCDDVVIKLKKTPKIISLIKTLSPQTFLVGFKLLDGVSENKLIDTAINLKNKNNCDLVVANDLSHIRQGEHKAYIIDKNNKYQNAYGKNDIANKLIEKIF